jgi:hypothetical protein
MNEDTEFEDFIASFGKLMAKGLNNLPPSTRKMIADTVAGGGEIYTIVTPEPVMLSAMLSNGETNIELFRVTEQMH